MQRRALFYRANWSTTVRNHFTDYDEDLSLLRCDTVWLVKWLATYRRSWLPRCSQSRQPKNSTWCLTMEAVSASETEVTLRKSTRLHSPDDLNLRKRHSANCRFHTSLVEPITLYWYVIRTSACNISSSKRCGRSGFALCSFLFAIMKTETHCLRSRALTLRKCWRKWLARGIKLHVPRRHKPGVKPRPPQQSERKLLSYESVTRRSFHCQGDL